MTVRSTASNSTSVNTRSDVAVGVCFQINNVYAVDESESRFCVDMIINMTWIDPFLKRKFEEGIMRKEIDEYDPTGGMWSDFKKGWLFKDLQSAVFKDEEKYQTARVLWDTMDHKPKPTWLNMIQETRKEEDPLMLFDRKGRVGYSISIQAQFDEVMELHAFPFDTQSLDMRCYFMDTDEHHWMLENHPFEKNAWYGHWTRDKDHYIVDNPEWIFHPYLDDHQDSFISESSNSEFVR
jgi:hypothetical protein